MDSKRCIFCEIKTSNQNLWQNDNFFVIFDISPANTGHLLVIPLNHTISLLDLSDDAWIDLFKAIKQAHKILHSSNLLKVYTDMLEVATEDKSKEFIHAALESSRHEDKPSGFNYGVNDGISAGRTIHHLHWHIIPRYDKDVEDPIGGVRCVIPERQNYKSI